MDRKSKAIHPDKCSACLLPLPGGDLAQSIRERRQSPGHRRSTSGLGNLSSFETHQWGEGGMVWESNGSCLEGSEGSRVCWRSVSRHVLEGRPARSFSFMGGCGPVMWDQEKTTMKPEFSEPVISSLEWRISRNLEQEGALSWALPPGSKGGCTRRPECFKSDFQFSYLSHLWTL